MREIKGSYVRNNKLVPFKTQIPGEWAELDSKSFAAIIQVLHFRKADKHTIAVTLLALLFGKGNFHILHHLNDKRPEENFIYDLVPLTNFLLETQPPVKNFFPKLNIRKKVCLAPDDNLGNLSFGEWCFAFQFYHYYSLTQDDQWLNKLIAVLYRPADPEQRPDSVNYKGDCREAFNENLIDKRSLDVAHIQSKFKLAVLAWFSVAVQDLQQYRPHVFPKVEDNPEAAADRTEQPEGNRTWLTVFRELLGPKWGTTEQLKNTNAMFILDALEEQQIAYLEAIKETRS
jgi:hypothetical protein